MAWTLISHVSTPSVDSNGFTSDSINTTGADLLIVAETHYTGGGTPTITDSKSNTWTSLTVYDGGSRAVRLWYSKPTSVGSGHNVTISGSGVYPALSFIAYSGSAASSPFASQNGAGQGFGSSQATGSVTPPEDGCLVVTAIGGFSTLAATPTINGGFTSGPIIEHWGNDGGQHFNIGYSHLIQTTATAANPTWTVSDNELFGTTIAVFKGSGGGPPPQESTGTVVARTGVRGINSAEVIPNVLPALDDFDDGPDTLGSPPWTNVGGFLITKGLSTGYAAAGVSGGMATTGLDQFTDSDATLLTDHTPNAGTSWTSAGGDNEVEPPPVITGNKLGPVNFGTHRYHLTTAPATAAYTVSCDVHYNTSGWDNHGGIRIHDYGNTILANAIEVYFSDTDNKWHLTTWFGFAQFFIAEWEDTGFTTGNSRHLSVTLDIDSNISVEIDDVERMTHDEDTVTTAGYGGIYLQGGIADGITVDNWLLQEAGTVPVGGGGDALYFWNESTFDVDQYSSYTIKGTPAGDESQYTMLMVRVDPDTTSMYSDGNCYIVYSDGGSSSWLAKIVSGVATELDRDDTITWDVDDVLKLEAEGTSITFYVNDVAKLNATDSAVTAGRAGIGGYTIGDLLYIDDFEADNFVESVLNATAAIIGRVGARPTVVERKQGLAAPAVQAGSRGLAAITKRGAATPTARSGVKGTCAGVKTIAAAAAITARTGGSAVLAGQSSKSFRAFTGARGVVAGSRPVGVGILGTAGVQASIAVTGKQATTALAAGRIGARIRVSPYAGVGTLQLSPSAVVWRAAPYTYNIIMTGINTDWSDDTAWTIQPSLPVPFGPVQQVATPLGPTLASSSIVVSGPTLATWFFTLGPGIGGSFTISDGTNNAILVVLPQTFSIIPSTKVWVPTSGLTFSLLGDSTSWTEDTEWTIVPGGGVSLAASQIIVTDTTHATWTLTLGPGTDGVFTLSDGTTTQSLTITSGVVSIAQTGPRGINSGYKTGVATITGHTDVRATFASLLIGANTVLLRTGLRSVTAKAKQGLASGLARVGARAFNVLVLIRPSVTFGRTGFRSNSATVKRGAAQPTTRVAVRATNLYLKTRTDTPTPRIGVRATATSASTHNVAVLAQTGVTSTIAGVAQHRATPTAHAGISSAIAGQPVTARSMFGSVGSIGQASGIKTSTPTPVTQVAVTAQCSGAKLGVQAPITARTGLSTNNIQLKSGLAQPTWRTGAVGTIFAPQAHNKPIIGSGGVRASSVIAGIKTSTSQIGRAGTATRTQGFGNQDKTMLGRFGMRARMTADGTVGPIVDNVPGTLRAGDRALAVLRAFDALRR